MIPDRYTTEKMAREYRQTLLREAEQERMLASLPGHRSSLMRHLVACVGMLLVALGTRLKQFEQHCEPVALMER